MPLTESAKRFLAACHAAPTPPLHQLPIASARAMTAAIRPRFNGISRPRITEFASPDANLSLWTVAPPQPAGCLLYLHGGGWVMNSVETHAALCCELARRTGFTVASLEYRLAPEHPYPAAVRDTDAAVAQIAAHREEFDCLDRPLVVGGDSAGANLALAAAQLDRDSRRAINGLLLFYPVVDDDFDRPSYVEYSEDHFLSREAMMWYWDQYAPAAEDRANPLVAPLKAASLAGLPPTFVLTAECDPLHDEGVALAERLTADGVATVHVEAAGLIHGFLRRYRIFPEAGEYFDRTAQWLAQVPAPRGEGDAVQR